MIHLRHAPQSSQKKFVVQFEDGKRIQFGQRGYSDFTDHQDEKRRRRYLGRHKREDWTDLRKAGTWSRYILWNKKSLEESIQHMARKFKIRIEFYRHVYGGR